MKIRWIFLCCLLCLSVVACQVSPGTTTSVSSSSSPSPPSGEGINPTATSKPEGPTSGPGLSRGVESSATPTRASGGSTAGPARTPSGTSTPEFITPKAPLEPVFTDGGPYLGFVENDAESSVLVLIDAYHLGHRRIDIPLGESPYDSSGNDLSSDSKYFVYYEGSLQSSDLTLALIDLESERVDIRIPVVSSDYKAKLEELAADLFANPPEELMDYPLSRIKESLEFSFQFGQYGIGAHAWSPDGKHLAFAAQIDGPSSDLYVFDTDTHNLRRLTSGRSNIYDISWSPDGRWILHGSAYWVGQGTFLTNHLASVDGSRVVSFPTYMGQYWRGWASSSLFLLSAGENGPGTYDLKAIDVASMETISLWPSTYTNLAFDPTRFLLLFTHWAYFYHDVEPGLYMMNVGGAEAKMISDNVNWELGFVGLREYPFLGVNDSHGTVLISEDGEFKQIDDEIHQILISPDKEYIALYDLRGSKGLSIYNVGEENLQQITPDRVDDIAWREDSKGLFFFSQDALYFYNLGSRELIRVLEDVSWDSIPGPIKWVHP